MFECVIKKTNEQIQSVTTHDNKLAELKERVRNNIEERLPTLL